MPGAKVESGWRTSAVTEYGWRQNLYETRKLGVEESESWSRWMQGRKHLIRQACQHLTLPSNALALDVASGNGDLTKVIGRETGASLVLNDSDRNRCADARAAGQAIVRSDVRHLPFASGIADLVIAMEIVANLPRHDALPFLDELYRVTKAGGWLILSTPNRYGIRSWMGIAKYVLDGTIWNGLDPTHVMLYSPRSLRKLVEQRFEIRAIYGYYLIPEISQHSTPFTYIVSSNPILANLSYKHLIVARRLS